MRKKNGALGCGFIYESKLPYIELQGPSRPVNNDYHVGLTR